MQLTSEPFCGAIYSYCELLNAHYADRLQSIFLFGSVHRGEADPLASDLDFIVVTTDGFSSEDREWEMLRWQHQEAVGEKLDVNVIKIDLTRASSRSEILSALFPETSNLLQQELILQKVLNGKSIDVHEHTILKAALCARTLLYDSTLVYGENLLRNATFPAMDTLWARFYLTAPYFLVQNTLYPQKIIPINWPFPLQPLHPDESRSLRKLARVGVICCACILMHERAFKSWEAAVVLPAVGERYPQWSAILGKTDQYCTKTEQSISKNSVLSYLNELFEFMEWTKSTMERSCHK